MRRYAWCYGFLSLFAAGLFHPCNGQSLPDTAVKKIDNLFAAWNRDNSPGFAVGVVRNDSLIFAKGYGMANLEYKVAISPSTIFHMASVSKQFTAYSIVLLASQGKLKLDDDIHQYLPWFPDLKAKITIRQLMNHTSGIRDQWQLLATAGTRLDDVITQEQIIKILSKQQALNFKPGDKFNYSNSGFTMLAEIVKAVTGQSLRKFTDSAIFKPLGMMQTHFHDNYTEIVANRAYSYQRQSLVSFSNAILSYSNAGATSLFTNINDLSKWVMNFYKPVAGTAADIDQLVTKAILNSGEKLSYALGITSDTYKGWKQYSHSGNDAGYRTYLTVFPDLKMGFMVFSNLGDANVTERLYKLVDLFISNTTEEPLSPVITLDSAKALVPDELRAAKIAGKYISDQGVQFNFILRDKRLYWERANRSDLMYPALKDSFIVAKTPEVKFVFNEAADKNMLADQFWPGNNRQLLKYAADSLSEKELQQYTGVYYCPELESRYAIELRGRQLVMTNIKYPDSNIRMAGRDHLFTNFWWMGHLAIIWNGKKVAGFEVNDGRVMHLRFNKLQ